MSEQDKNLEQLTAGFQRYPQVLVNVQVREKKPFNDIETLRTSVREIETKLGERGRLLLRYSGTESLARVMIEGESQSEIEDYANSLADTIKLAIGVP